MIGSVGLFWIIGTFHITNFDSEGINIGNFFVPNNFDFMDQKFFISEKGPKMDISGFSIVKPMNKND